MDGVAGAEPEIIAAHAVLGFEMVDDGVDGGPAAQLARDASIHVSQSVGRDSRSG